MQSRTSAARVVLGGALVALSGAMGCAQRRSPTPHAAPVSLPPPSTPLIFNPGEAVMIAGITYRPPWPDAFVADRSADQTFYRETLHDWHDSLGWDGDLYQRHFYSVRTGQLRR